MPCPRLCRAGDASDPLRNYRPAATTGGAAPGLRTRVEGVLRDVALVLHLTRTVSDALAGGGDCTLPGRP